MKLCVLAQRSMSVELRGQLRGISSLLPPLHGLQGPTSGRQGCTLKTLPTKPFC